MGDRANVMVEMPTSFGPKAGAKGVYLYTHYYGSEWPEMLRDAMVHAEGRWTDEQYFLRILTSRMFAPIHDQETGGGIGLTIGDNSYPITVVDVKRQTVSWAEEGEEGKRSARYGELSFKEFVAQARASYPRKDRG